MANDDNGIARKSKKSLRWLFFTCVIFIAVTSYCKYNMITESLISEILPLRNNRYIEIDGVNSYSWQSKDITVCFHGCREGLFQNILQAAEELHFPVIFHSASKLKILRKPFYHSHSY